MGDLLQELLEIWDDNLWDHPAEHLREVIRTGQIHVFRDELGIAGWIDWMWLTEDEIQPALSGHEAEVDRTTGLNLYFSTGRFVRCVPLSTIRRVLWQVIRSRPTRTVCYVKTHKDQQQQLCWVEVKRHG